ncbi:kelch-like ECH-associated protein 1B [Aplysia californica]|uniref:Kelch-like ECH-associated protein 1B n=1 Tax=Aplysia californica TaxID=6500 RepID=A0ABM1A1C6_APLCA|nr:kelch-like ECH-associated protein 1B [Aplysia californica]
MASNFHHQTSASHRQTSSRTGGAARLEGHPSATRLRPLRYNDARPQADDPQTEELLERMRRQMPTSCYMMRPLLTEHGVDGSTRFHIYKYPTEALAAMNEFRLEGSLCDITLNVNGECIRAHRIVLAACSAYFRAMFTNGMMEASCSEVTIREPNITPPTLRILVEFAYTHEILVTQENVQALLVSAIFLEMTHVIEACTLFMEQQLEPSNCIGFANFAAIHGCLDLEAKAKKYIHEHFCEVIKYDEFLTLEHEDMINIVKQDELNIRCETQVFQAVVRWVEHDTDRRLNQLVDLLDKVRLTSMAPCFLENQLEKCTVIKQLPHCVQLLLDKLRKLQQHSGDTLDRPRKPCKPLVVYSVGGFYRKVMDSLKCFECYNPVSKEWTRLPDLPRPRCGPGVTSLQGLVYVVGGRVMRCGESVDSCSLDVYDPGQNMWINGNPMSVARNRVGVAVLDNMIYAVGGSDCGEQHKSAERYNPESDSWERISPMSTVRMSCGVAVVNRLLYAVGGYDGRNRLSSVECFHPEDNEWRLVEPMNEARSGAGVVVLGGCVYAVGGFDGARQLQSVERYDPVKRCWDYVASLQRARSGVGVAVVDNKIFALGGFDGRDFLPCVECYNPELDQWQSETIMLCERSGHGVAVERQPTIG